MTRTSLALACSIVAFSIGALQFFGVQPGIFIGADAYYQSDDEPKYVTCQSAIKLSHKRTKERFGVDYLLFSLTNQNYGNGSRQQVVTFAPEKSDHAFLWIVREGNDKPQCEAAKPIECGSLIRLTHHSSQVNLHSHNVRASLTGQAEVSGFGNNGEGDGGDNWIVQCVDHSRIWQRDKTVRLKHEATGKYLQAVVDAQFTERNCGGNCPIMNHLEAFAREQSDANADLSVTGGIFLTQ